MSVISQTNTNWPTTSTFTTSRLGWECPKCGRCYSPDTIQCLSCGGYTTTGPYCYQNGGTNALEPNR